MSRVARALALAMTHADARYRFRGANADPPTPGIRGIRTGSRGPRLDMMFS